MKFFVSFILQASVISIVSATHLFSDDDIRKYIEYVLFMNLYTVHLYYVLKPCIEDMS